MFPATTKSNTIHGICVTGASVASATSNNSSLTYESIKPFQSGIQAWSDHDYTIEGVENTPCADGIYLRPSIH